MDVRRLAVILLTGLCGCGTVGHRVPVDYRTVPADPHHDTDQARLQTERATQFLEKCQLDKAEQALQRALIADVTYGPAHNNLGQLYLSQGKYYLAAWEFEYATKLMPDRPEPHNNLGLVYERVGKLDEAIQFYESATELQPDNSQFLGNLARCRLRRGDRDEATRRMLTELLMHETRPDWVDWANEQLSLAGLPVDDSPPRPDQSILEPKRGPALIRATVVEDLGLPVAPRN